jgi:hypothetical protein
MKITRRRLNRVIKEAILIEQQKRIPFIDETDGAWENKLANYAHANDIQGALADSDLNDENLDLTIDDFKGNQRWIEHPDWNAKRVKASNFLNKLEDAWHDYSHQSDQKSLANSPNKEELKALGGNLHLILDKDLQYLTWQPIRRGGVVVAIEVEDIEGPQGFPLGNAQFTLSAENAAGHGVSLMDIMDVLNKGGAKSRKRKQAAKRSMPHYD